MPQSGSQTASNPRRRTDDRPRRTEHFAVHAASGKYTRSIEGAAGAGVVRDAGFAPRRTGRSACGRTATTIVTASPLRTAAR